MDAEVRDELHKAAQLALSAERRAVARIQVEWHGRCSLVQLVHSIPQSRGVRRTRRGTTTGPSAVRCHREPRYGTGLEHNGKRHTLVMAEKRADGVDERLRILCNTRLARAIAGRPAAAIWSILTANLRGLGCLVAVAVGQVVQHKHQKRVTSGDTVEH
eukprot:5267157-Prymnesium_polylepis.3